MMMLIAFIITLSSDCGYGLPCGPIPWDLPSLPRILSPTPIPTVHIVATATATHTPNPTQTPTPNLTLSPTPDNIDVNDIDEMVDDFSELADRTPAPILYSDDEINFETIQSLQTVNFWGYIIGLFSINIGVFQPVLQVGVFGFFTAVFVKSATLFIPVIVFIAGIVRKAVSFIVGFIPGLG